MRNGIVAGLFLAAVCLCFGTAQAATLIRGYAPERHDRFFVGESRAFLGEAWDFSGVGRTAGGPWGTLVSDRYFLSAEHYHPGIGQSLTFWGTNSLAGPSFHYVVAGGQRIGGTDLWLGWLATAADESLARYAVPLLGDPADIVGQELVTYGVDHRVGRNVADTVDVWTEGGSSSQALWFDYDNNDVPSVGGDEAYLWYGDSGAPTFGLVNDGLVLLGIHWSITDGGSGNYEGDSSMDSFVPSYVLSIDAGMSALGESLILTAIPEPGGYSAGVAAVLAFLIIRRGGQNPPGPSCAS